jgi:hypothetical protein
MKIINPLHIRITIHLKNERNSYSFLVGITDSFKLPQKPSSLSLFQHLLHQTVHKLQTFHLPQLQLITFQPGISFTISSISNLSSLSLFRCSYISIFFSLFYIFIFMPLSVSVLIHLHLFLFFC